MSFFLFKGYSIPVDLLNMTGGGPDTFEVLASGHIQYLQNIIGIAPHHNVLEMGCGIGRDAIPLTEILSPRGAYLGIDIIGRSIDWLRRNVGARHPNFAFVHFDIKDSLHNPTGTIKTTDTTLPLAESSIDRIFLWSVFTHMFETDIIHYLREFARVLKPDGLVMATCFIVDADILAQARKVNLTPFNLRFEHSLGADCYINDQAHPAGAVAYTIPAFDRMLRDSGLCLARPYMFGQWWGKADGEGYGQDTMVLRQKLV